jgi:transposase InsO family protein
MAALREEAAMGWKKVTIMSQRIEFVTLAKREGATFSELCRRFGVSRKTGYKFVKRYGEEGIQGLNDRSRRPKDSPNATQAQMERLILDLRDKHPAWGGRKLKRRAEDIGYEGVPSPSTITEILKRNGKICREESEKHKAWRRFEAERPNDMWQMDFKGHFPSREGRCHPLTILDDHSRYALCIGACGNEHKETVEERLRDVFRRYGLPWAVLTDNGSPWGSDSVHRHTSLTVWLMRLGIDPVHSRVYHPQTLGKDERFHRTMSAEVVSDCMDRSLSECQRLFDRWRVIYNTERPHESLGMKVPADCYHVSEREFPERFREWEYSPSDAVRKVQQGGIISYKNTEWRVGKAFKGQRVGIRPSTEDGRFDVFFRNYKIAQICLV